MESPKHRHAYKIGRKGEKTAAFIFSLKGYKILQKRYKTPVGEIDLIARKGEFLVFIEVKSRSDFTSAAEAITEKQKRRIIRAAEYFLSGHPKMAHWSMRFDVFLCVPPLGYRHIENVWDM